MAIKHLLDWRDQSWQRSCADTDVCVCMCVGEGGGGANTFETCTKFCDKEPLIKDAARLYVSRGGGVLAAIY